MAWKTVLSGWLRNWVCETVSLSMQWVVIFRNVVLFNFFCRGPHVTRECVLYGFTVICLDSMYCMALTLLWLLPIKMEKQAIWRGDIFFIYGRKGVWSSEMFKHDDRKALRLVRMSLFGLCMLRRCESSGAYDQLFIANILTSIKQ